MNPECEPQGSSFSWRYFEEGSRFVNSHKTREFPCFEVFNKHSEPSGAACIVHLCYSKTTIASTMVLLKEITKALEPYPDLHDSLPFLDAERFIRFAVQVKREIQLNQPATATGPPLHLPIYIHEFLRDVLTFQDLDTLQCWSAFQHIIWCSELTADLSISEAALFERSRSSWANEQIGEW